MTIANIVNIAIMVFVGQPFKENRLFSGMFGPSFCRQREVRIDGNGVYSTKRNGDRVQDARITSTTSATRQERTVTLGGDVTTYGRFRGRYMFENEEEAERFARCLTEAAHAANAQDGVAINPAGGAVAIGPAPAMHPAGGADAIGPAPAVHPAGGADAVGPAPALVPPARGVVNDRVPDPAPAPAITVGECVNHCRRAAMGPSQAASYFEDMCSSQVIRWCGNNNHPRRYAFMADGSVVDTDKLTQLHALCWIQKERDVQALSRHFLVR